MQRDIVKVQETKEDGKKYKRQYLSKYGRQNNLTKLGRYLDVMAKQKNGRTVSLRGLQG